MKAGYVGLLGLPNAGKSTLTNALVGEKVSIVTSKPQTTRSRVLGVLTNETTQMVFMDAPGYVEAESGLNAYLKAELEDVIKDADCLLVVLNLDAEQEKDLTVIIEMAKASGLPWMAVITKSDLKLDHRILRLRDQLAGQTVVVGSAIKGAKELRAEVLPWIESHLPEVESFFYPTDEYTPQTLRQMCAEIVREKCFEFLHQEVPYGLAVRIAQFREEEIIKIYAEILIEKENHKPIVIGKKGEMMKRIGIASREEMEKLIGGQVFLQLHVAVQKNWQKNPRTLKELGYVVPE